MTPFGSESPKSISKNKAAVTRPSTSSGHSQQGSSGGGSAAVSPSRSVTPAPGSRVPTPTPTSADTRTRPWTRTRTRTRTAAASSKTPTMMSSTQTVTSTAAAESGLRFASSSEAYRYQGTLRSGMTPNPYSITPTLPSSLFVNATATISTEATAPLSGAAGSSTSSRARAEGELTGHSNEESQAQMWSRSHSHWSARIAGEIPIDDTTDSEANALRSPHSPYGPASASNAVITPGFAPIRRRGHVPYPYGPASSSGTAPGVPADSEPGVFRPPSLAAYTLTEPAAQASAGAGLSSWRDTVIGSSSSSTTTTTTAAARGWLPPIQYPPSYRDAAQWNSPPSAARMEASSGSAMPFALPGASPTHTGSPASTSGTATSSSWAPIPSGPAELDESARSRSAMLSSSTRRRPSLTRSAAGLPSSSSSSSSSMLHSSFAGSRSSITSTAALTSASAASASASRVPGPASSYDALPFAARSPAAQSTVSGRVASEHSPTFATFAAGHPQAVAAATAGEQQRQQLQQPSSSPYDVQAQSSLSAQLARPDASPVHEREQHESAAAFQAPFQQGGLSGHSSPEARAEGGDSSGAMASGPSGRGPQEYLFAGTNTPAYSRQFGPGSVPDPDPLPLVGRSAALLHTSTVPVAITAAEPYNYPYASPPAETVPAPSSVSAAAALSGSTGGGSSSSGQSTRKRNHACWMCHKSFDRPSTLRKHLLVHTGEKAYVCTICGRRFGVASNLNRHTRRCIARPVNSSAFHRTSGSASGTSASAGTLTTSDQDAMAREQTNPDVRRVEREREGREVPGDDSERPAAPTRAPETPSTPGPSRAPQTRGRRRLRSNSPAPLDAPSASASSLPEAGPSSRQTPFQLRPAFGGSGGDGQGSSQVAVATASTSTAEAEGERRPKRRRRAPSPSRWVPASLRAFSLSPTRHRTSTPLPPVSPGFDSATGTWEERDSYATPDDENVDPVGDSAAAADPSAAENAARRREERRRNFEYCPYHPCGWTGRLPGPAVVGSDLTNYTKPTGGSGGGGGGGGPGSRHHYSGGNTGGGLSFMFEFSVAAAG